MTATAQELPAAWRGILQDGERILWQGGPKQAFYWRKHYSRGVLGAIGVVALFLLRADTPPVMFGIVVAVALILVFGMPLFDSLKRRYSFFTLTDQRAFIGTDLPIWPRQLTGYPIDDTTQLLFKHDGVSAVYFAHYMKPTNRGEYRVDVRFENITEGEHVYRLMKQIKERIL